MVFTYFLNGASVFTGMLLFLWVFYSLVPPVLSSLPGSNFHNPVSFIVCFPDESLYRNAYHTTVELLGYVKA